MCANQGEELWGTKKKEDGIAAGGSGYVSWLMMCLIYVGRETMLSKQPIKSWKFNSSEGDIFGEHTFLNLENIIINMSFKNKKSLSTLSASSRNQNKFELDYYTYCISLETPCVVHVSLHHTNPHCLKRNIDSSKLFILDIFLLVAPYQKWPSALFEANLHIKKNKNIFAKIHTKNIDIHWCGVWPVCVRDFTCISPLVQPDDPKNVQ